MGKEDKEKPLLDALMDMCDNIDHKQPFCIVGWNEDLPKELEQFKIGSPPCAKGDNSYIK